jgi:flagellar biosynthesis/type III secretory pathway protein FliH
MFEVPDSIIKDEFFSDLLSYIHLKNLNEKDMEAYNTSERHFLDLSIYASGNRRQGLEEGLKRGIKQGIQEGIQQGMQQGIQQGRQEGSEDEKQQIALNALKLGYSSEEVAALTGLTLEQLEELPR